MSLKEKLKSAIYSKGYISNSQVYQICAEGNYKPDNATRRLRELINETPEIRPDRDEKGVIHGYRYSQNQFNQTVNMVKPNFKNITSPVVQRFMNEHCKPQVEVKEVINTLF